ncbi:MAG: HAMP domain-containing sensor histidine kinase [Bacillota bacterium]|nr:HAMP domain-containing sensor histidine kinase [Bacillota bacterium]
MKNSIQKRLFKSFTAVIAIVVILLEAFVIFATNTISYQNMERIMTDNLDYAMNSIVFRTESLDILDILDPSFRQYFNDNNAQVQIINQDGYVIFDSLGVFYTEKIIYPDITMAKNGQKGVWRGRVDYSKDQVMAMSVPIVNSTNQNIGTLRMLISLNRLNSLKLKYTGYFIGLGLLAVFIALLISQYLAKNIVKPLKNLNDVAVKIANGQFNVRSSVDSHDEIEQVSDSINYMAEELIKRDQLKNDFISSVSHELRTPLTSIKGWALTILNADKIDEKLKNEGLEIIVNEADRLSDLVEELLDFSRFTSGKVSLKKEEVDVAFFLEEIVKQMKPRVLSSGHLFLTDFGDNLGNMVVDRDRLKQVFINILDNAIKFTEDPGLISIYARRTKADDLVFTISDTGIGIPEENIKRVKEKFFKGSLGKSHTGLGLSISDEIINLHGGNLDIESKLGQGTKISINIEADQLKTKDTGGI